MKRPFTLSRSLTFVVDYEKLATLSAISGLRPEDIEAVRKSKETQISEGRVEKIKFYLLKFGQKHGRPLGDEEIYEELELLKRSKAIVPVSFGKLILFTPNFWQRFYNKSFLELPFGTVAHSKMDYDAKLYPIKRNGKIIFLNSGFFSRAESLMLLSETDVEKINFRKRIAYTVDGNNRSEYGNKTEAPAHVMGL